MFGPLLRMAEFLYYKLVITTVDKLTELPRETEPDALRLYRQNLALKAQIDALTYELEVLRKEKGKRTTLQTRAAQVFAFLMTRGDRDFQRYFLSATLATIERWLSRFRSDGTSKKKGQGGRKRTAEEIVELVLTFKRENPSWGHRRIREELRKIGVRVGKGTVQRILHENGFPPHPGHNKPYEMVRSAAKDAVWALDFFAVRLAGGKWVQALLIIDIYSRELLDLRVHDGWDVDSVWTARAVNHVFTESGRRPQRVIHDHGTTFAGQFERLLRVEDVEQVRSVTHRPWTNIYAERHIWTVRHELLRHLAIRDASKLQWYLDEFRRFSNTVRPHQGIKGLTPLAKGHEQPQAKVLSLAEVRARKLTRQSFAHGLLTGYALEPEAEPALPKAA